MKKITALLLALILLCVMCACGEEEVVVTPKIKIGVFEPLSGQNAAGGKQEYLGVLYAHSVTPTVKLNGTTYEIEVIPADNCSTEDGAVAAAEYLVEQGVSVVLGSYGSAVSAAASDIFSKAGLPVIGASCTNTSLTQGNDHYFRICYTDELQGKLLASYVQNKMDVKTVYCLGQQGNAYDQGLIDSFKGEAEAFGLRVVTAFFPEKTRNFSSYLAHAAEEGAELIFAPCSVSYVELLVEQAGKQQLQLPILGGDTWDSNVVLDAALGTQLEIYVSSFYAEGNDSGFDSAFIAWMAEHAEALANNGGNDQIAAVSAMGYDAYHLALTAIAAANSMDKADVLAALPSVNYAGVTGTVSFDGQSATIVLDAQIRSREGGDAQIVRESIPLMRVQDNWAMRASTLKSLMIRD